MRTATLFLVSLVSIIPSLISDAQTGQGLPAPAMAVLQVLKQQVLVESTRQFIVVRTKRLTSISIKTVSGKAIFLTI